jgi:hypothetical protein
MRGFPALAAAAAAVGALKVDEVPGRMDSIGVLGAASARGKGRL